MVDIDGKENESWGLGSSPGLCTGKEFQELKCGSSSWPHTD